MIKVWLANKIYSFFRQLRYVVSLIQTSELHLKVVETAMVFLCTVLKYDPTQVLPLARDTSLGHLTLVVLSSGKLIINYVIFIY